MFYDRLKNICESKGITVTYLLKTLNISTSKGTAWKSGSTPNSEIALKIANYFNVSIDYLLGNEKIEKSPSPISDEDLKIYEMYSKLNSEDKELIVKMMDKMIK